MGNTLSVPKVIVLAAGMLFIGVGYHSSNHRQALQYRAENSYHLMDIPIDTSTYKHLLDNTSQSEEADATDYTDSGDAKPYALRVPDNAPTKTVTGKIAFLEIHEIPWNTKVTVVYAPGGRHVPLWKMKDGQLVDSGIRLKDGDEFVMLQNDMEAEYRWVRVADVGEFYFYIPSNWANGSSAPGSSTSGTDQGKVFKTQMLSPECADLYLDQSERDTLEGIHQRNRLLAEGEYSQDILNKRTTLAGLSPEDLVRTVYQPDDAHLPILTCDGFENGHFAGGLGFLDHNQEFRMTTVRKAHKGKSYRLIQILGGRYEGMHYWLRLGGKTKPGNTYILPSVFPHFIMKSKDGNCVLFCCCESVQTTILHNFF